MIKLIIHISYFSANLERPISNSFSASTDLSPAKLFHVDKNHSFFILMLELCNISLYISNMLRRIARDSIWSPMLAATSSSSEPLRGAEH